MSGYFEYVRREIEPLLPAKATRVLDVGCGIGATTAWVKSRYPDAWTIGLEGNGALYDQLSANVDEAHIVDLNADLPEIGSPDLILFLDVLEHLVSPERLLAKVSERLAPGGMMIVSLPNVAHLSVSLPLLLKGRFDYADQGILDRTHLRFFVKDSAVSLLNSCGLEVREGLMSGFRGPKTRLLDTLTGGMLRERLAKQYIMSAKPMNGAGQNSIRWRRAI